MSEGSTERADRRRTRGHEEIETNLLLYEPLSLFQEGSSDTDRQIDSEPEKEKEQERESVEGRVEGGERREDKEGVGIILASVRRLDCACLSTSPRYPVQTSLKTGRMISPRTKETRLL